MTQTSGTIRPIEAGLMVLLGAIWGASFLFMRLASPEFGPIALIFMRLSIASVILTAIVAAQGRIRELFQHPFKMAFLGLANSAIPFTLFSYATLSLSAGFASVLNATAPFFGALISVFVLRMGLARSQWMGLAIGFAGVCVLVWDKLQLGGSAWSIGACLVAAFLYGVAAHFSKRQLSHVHPMVVATSSQIAASLLMMPLAFLNWPAQTPSSISWLAALFLGTLCTGIALAIYFPLLHSIGATKTMSVAYLIPMFGVVWGAIFLHESITSSIVLGGLLILTGLTCVTRSNVPVAPVIKKVAENA